MDWGGREAMLAGHVAAEATMVAGISDIRRTGPTSTFWPSHWCAHRKTTRKLEAAAVRPATAVAERVEVARLARVVVDWVAAVPARGAAADVARVVGASTAVAHSDLERAAEEARTAASSEAVEG